MNICPNFNFFRQPGAAAISGHFELNGLPSRADLIGRIEVTFALDASGILSAKARDVVSGKQAEMEIDYKNGTSSNKNAA